MVNKIIIILFSYSCVLFLLGVLIGFSSGYNLASNEVYNWAKTELIDNSFCLQKKEYDLDKENNKIVNDLVEKYLSNTSMWGNITNRS